jgi:hypothetical protein
MIKFCTIEFRQIQCPKLQMDSFELSTRFMVTWWLAEGNSPPTQTWRKHQWRCVRAGQVSWELQDNWRESCAKKKRRTEARRSQL